MTKWILILFVVAAGIQLIPYGRSHTHPPVLGGPAWNSPQTRDLFFKACSDCHSNETVWPWYSHIAPVSWLVQWDVTRGREDFNVSEWGHYEQPEAREAAEVVQEGEMPPWIYILPHPEALLPSSEKEALNDGLIATFGKENGNDENHRDEPRND